MQKTVSSIRSGAAVLYRERLSPSLWVIVSAAVAAPMAALVVAPIDTTLALDVVVLPAQEDEFTCVNCFLVKHRSQLDHEDAGGPICSECAA
jgi:hypothetical protein